VSDKIPFFSIVIPTYNRKDFLKIAVESVLRQTHDDLELIIIDDGSRDNTKQVLDEYLQERRFKISHRVTKSQSHQVTESEGRKAIPLRAQARSLGHQVRGIQEKADEVVTWCRGDLCIRYFYQENKGPGSARNRGIREAKGEYIAFLDSDDRFVMRKLEVTYEYIRKNPSFKIFHTEEIWYSNGRLLPQKKIHQKPDGFVFRNALKLCCISISTCCIHRDIFKDVGVFDENMPVCEDYDFWLRVTAKYPIRLIPQPLTIKEGGHLNQQSKKYPALDKYRIYAINKLLDSKMLTEEQYKFAIKELKEKCMIYIKGAEKRGKFEEIKSYIKLIEKFIHK